MGSKRVLDPQQVVVDGDMSSDVTTSATQIMHTDRPSYEIAWTGTPTGTFSVEVSHTGNNWSEVSLSSPITAAGSADSAFVDIESGAKYVRLKYTASSGSGTLNAWVASKSISG